MSLFVGHILGRSGWRLRIDGMSAMRQQHDEANDQRQLTTGVTIRPHRETHQSPKT